MLLELSIVVVLTLINGVLAMSELAIVSSRTPRLQVMADQGSRGARLALRLAADPGRFLSSVQIGITLVGVLAGAFSGATLGLRLAGTLTGLGLAPALAQTLGVGTVVVAITYLSLVLGELVPKQIALRAPEAVAVRIAPLLHLISIVAAPVVWLLDRSGRLVLAALGQSGAVERNVTDEEVRLVLSEARSSGAMEKAETEMIAGVMRIADRTARGLMVPRREVEVIDLAQGPQAALAQFRRTGRSRLPVRDGGPDDIVGVIRARDALALTDGSDAPDLRALILEAPVVRDGMAALDVMEALRRSAGHMVLVYDEYGAFEGIITPMDLLEAIAGDFSTGPEAEERMVARDDGSLLVAGWMPVDEFAERLGLRLDDDRDYETVAGLVIDRTGTLPDLGAHVRIGPWRIEVVDLDGRRIDKVLVQRLPDP